MLAGILGERDPLPSYCRDAQPDTFQYADACLTKMTGFITSVHYLTDGPIS